MTLRRRWSAAIALLAVVAVGCYSYVPVDTDAGRRFDRGTGVRVHLSTPMEIDLRDVVARDISTVQGEVIGWSGDELAVSAFTLFTPGGFEHSAAGQTVTIPADRIAGIEEKRLDKAKTAGLTVGVVALTTVTGILLGEGGIFGEGEPGDGQEPPTEQ